MRFAFISDLHFGYSEDSLPQAKEAFLQALEEDVDAIILPGDVFDARVPRQEVVFEAVQLFREVLERSERKVTLRDLGVPEEPMMEWSGVPLLAIPGTHERRSKGMTNIIQILHEAGLVFNLHGRKLSLELGGERVVLQGMQGIPEEYVRKTLEAAAFRPVPEAYNIFVFHQSLIELLPYEREDFISLQELPPGFDLYLNGHIHWNVDVEEQGRRLIVPGSTVITQMRKREEQGKGFYLYDTKTEEAEFRGIASRPFFLVELQFEKANAVEVKVQLEEALEKIALQPSAKPPFVRCLLQGTLAKGLTPSSVEVGVLEAKFAGKMRLFVEKRFEALELKDKIEFLKKLREEKKSAKELGMALLRQRLKENGVHVHDEESFFEFLAEGQLGEAEKLL